MRQELRTLYSFRELSETARLAAVERFQNNRMEDGYTPWQEEILESYKAIIEALHLRVSHRDGNILGFQIGAGLNSMQGKRAMAWVENNLLAPLRIPWRGPRRTIARKHGRHYYAGRVPPCPFTGYCADDDFINAFIDAIKHGDTMEDAARNLSNVCDNLMEEEREAWCSEECVREDLMEDPAECFLEDGSDA